MPRRKKQIDAGGFMDVIRDPIGTIKEAFRSIPSKLNNISTRTIEQYGNSPITSITIGRKPIPNHFSSALNAVSLGVFNKLAKKYGYDKFYHLFLIITTEKGKVIFEKLSTVNIAPFQATDVNDVTEYMPIQIPSGLTLAPMVDKTFAHMGPEKFYDYDSMTNNCQNFVMSILTSNNLLTPKAKKFVWQDMTGIIKGLTEANVGYLPSVAKGVTRLRSFASRLVGDGKEKDTLLRDQYNMNATKIKELAIQRETDESNFSNLTKEINSLVRKQKKIKEILNQML